MASARRGEPLADRLVEHVETIAIPKRLAHEHRLVVLLGVLYDTASSEARGSMASLTATELTAVGRTTAAVLDNDPR